jgi:hypothetical protein
MSVNQEYLNALLQEIKKLNDRFELSKIVGADYYEPGMMEYLDKSFGTYNADTGDFVIRFESRGTRYDGRTEQIEKVKVGDEIKIVRDAENEFNSNNFMLITERNKNVGNMPAELCNVIAPLFDIGLLKFQNSSVSFVEPISKRNRHANQAVLFVELAGIVNFTNVHI